MKALLATKIGMTKIFAEDGRSFATTVLYVEPNQVLSTRTLEKDGYVATQVGYQTIKESKLIKPKKGEFKKAKSEAKRIIRELRDVTGYNVGDQIKCSAFEKGEYIDAQGTSKGHGFTGSIKRHNFGVGPLGHGAGYPHRYVGSISGGRGGSQGQRVFKGTELPGHYGHETITVGNLLILDIIQDQNLILVRGAIPGPKNSIVRIKSSMKSLGKKDVIKLATNTKVKIEEVKIEEEKVIAVEEPANIETTIIEEKVIITETPIVEEKAIVEEKTEETIVDKVKKENVEG